MKTLKILAFVLLALTIGCESTNKPDTPGIVVLPAPSSLPKLPYIKISNNIKFLSALEVWAKIKEHSGNYYYAEDSRYFIPTKQNMDVIVPYLDDVFKELKIHYIADATDCDDFARLKSELAQMILGQAYGIEASPTIFVIFVKQKETWAGVPAGEGHAVCVYVCINEEKGNKVEVYVWEPQSTKVVNVSDYPNKDEIFYVGQGIEKIATEAVKKDE